MRGAFNGGARAGRPSEGRRATAENLTRHLHADDLVGFRRSGPVLVDLREWCQSRRFLPSSRAEQAPVARNARPRDGARAWIRGGAPGRGRRNVTRFGARHSPTGAYCGWVFWGAFSRLVPGGAYPGSCGLSGW